MPTVSFNSNYARIAYPDNVLPSFDRSNWTVGISMSVPFSTGGRQRGDELVARADLEQSRLQESRSRLAALDTRSAWAELLAARVAWESTAGTVQQANRAYQIADVRYGAGVSTQLELSDARVQRQQARPIERWPRATSRWRARVSRCFRISRLEMPCRCRQSDHPATDGRPSVPAASRSERRTEKCFRAIHTATGRNSMSTVVPGNAPVNLAVLSASCARRSKARAPRPLRSPFRSARRTSSRSSRARSSSARSSPAS